MSNERLQDTKASECMQRYIKVRREAAKKMNEALNHILEAEFEHQKFLLELRRAGFAKVAQFLGQDKESLLDALEHDYVDPEIRVLIAHLYLDSNSPQLWLDWMKEKEQI